MEGTYHNYQQQILSLIKQTPEQLAEYFLQISPSLFPFFLSHSHKKQIFKSEIFISQLILLLGQHELLPYLDIHSPQLQDFIPSLVADMEFGIWSCENIIKSSILADKTHIILEGKVSKMEQTRNQRVKGKSRKNSEQKIADKNLSSDYGKLFTFQNNNPYQVEEQTKYIKLSTQKMRSMKLIISSESINYTTKILISTLGISRYQVKTNNILKKTNKLIILKSEALRYKYSIIYVQKGQLLCENLNKRYKFTAGQRQTIDLYSQTDLFSIKATKDSALICLEAHILQQLMRTIPNFKKTFLKERKNIKQAHKIFFQKQKYENLFENQVYLEYGGGKKWKNRFSKRKNINKDKMVSQEDQDFLQVYKTELIVKSKQKLLKIIEQNEKQKGKKCQKIINYLQNNTKLKKQRGKSVLKRGNLSRISIAKSNRKSKENERQNTANTMIQSSKNEELFFTNCDTGIINKFLIDSQVYQREIRYLLSLQKNRYKKKNSDNSTSLTTRRSQLLKQRTISNRIRFSSLLDEEKQNQMEIISLNNERQRDMQNCILEGFRFSQTQRQKSRQILKRCKTGRVKFVRQ